MFNPKRVPTANAITTKDNGITVTRNDSTVTAITASNSYDIKPFSSGTFSGYCLFIGIKKSLFPLVITF